MENHPHDSICGCSIDQVVNEMQVCFDQVEQICEVLVCQSLAALSAQIETQKRCASAVVLFNPTGAQRRPGLAELASGRHPA
jgi:alpha-mannosidase